MTRFGDLIGGNETVVTPITTPPVVEKPVPPAPVVEEVKGVSKQDLIKLNKVKDQLARMCQNVPKCANMCQNVTKCCQIVSN